MVTMEGPDLRADLQATLEILGEKGLVIHADGGGWGVKQDVVTTTTTVTMTWLVGWFPTLRERLG